MAGFYGWAGTILSIDLTTGKVEREPLNPAFVRKYLGASDFDFTVEELVTTGE